MPVLLLATILSEVGKKQLASLADEDILERSSGDAEAKVEEVDKLSSHPVNGAELSHIRTFKEHGTQQQRFSPC